MPDFQSLVDSFNSPPTRHAMFVHLPIALAIIGLALALLAAILSKNKTCRTLAIACQVALGLAAFFTLSTGENAEAAIKIQLAPEVDRIVGEHEEMAEKIWMFAAGVAVLLVLSAVLRGAASTIFAWLGVLGTIATVGWVSKTADYGGELVYKFGVGTPQPAIATTTRPAADEPMEAGPGTAPLPDTSVNASADATKIAFFRDEAFPILSENCFNCHNASRVARNKSGLLDQTSRETLLHGGRSGPAVVPGEPDGSLLVHRLRGDDPDATIMPPGGKLTEKDIAIIEQWIRDGAVWADPAGRE